MNNKKNIIESILFVAGDPVSINLLSESLNLNKDEVIRILKELKEEKYNENSGIFLDILDEVALFITNKNYFEDVSNFFNRSEEAHV